MVIVLGIGLIGIAFPKLQTALTYSGEDVSEEVGSVIDTTDGNAIMRHKSTDLD